MTETTIYTLLMKVREGGSIVASASCGSDEIIEAGATGRIFHDKDGFGYVYRPRPRPQEPKR